MLKRLDDTDRVVGILRRFPGMTERALFLLHGITPAILYDCVLKGHVAARKHTVGHRSGNFDVYRFYAKETDYA